MMRFMIETMLTKGFFNETVECHPSGTAYVLAMETLDRNEWEELENLLAKRAGVEKDNNVVYSVGGNGGVLHFWFQDQMMHVGHRLFINTP